MPVIFENQSTRCPKCKNALTWKSHERIWTKEKEVRQFTFICNSCDREYLFKGDEVIEKTPSRNSIAESTAIRRCEFQAALARRCPECGGPITKSPGTYSLSCEWCEEEYRIMGGELVPKPPEPLPKKTLREYANAVRSQ